MLNISIGFVITIHCGGTYIYLAARDLPLLSRQLNSGSWCTYSWRNAQRFALQRGWKWSICALAVTGILRITAEIGMRSDLNASSRNATPSYFQSFQNVAPTPGIFCPPSPPTSAFHLSFSHPVGRYDARDSNKIEIWTGEWRRRSKRNEKRSVISSSESNRFLQRRMGRDGGGFNILIKTTRGFVVGVDEE